MFNINQPGNAVFLVGFVVYAGIRHAYAKPTMANEKVVTRLDGTEKILLTLVTLGSLLLPVVYLFSPLLAVADYPLPWYVSGFGAVLMLAALWLFWRSHADLGRNWSVTLEIRKDHYLVTGGVYRRIRHPMYAAIFLWCIAQGLLLSNWLAGWGALATFAPLYFIRAPREERMMCEFFGDEYRAYMRKTGRLFPRLFAAREA